MFLIRFIRFLKGYIIFTCSGGFPERFINLCSLNGINLWNAKSSNGILSACTTIDCYKKIRPCVRRSGMKIKLQKKCGLPFLLQPYTRRKGILTGMIISAVMLVFLCSCVWTIDIDGNENFTDKQIVKIAESYGIYPGAFKKNINQKEIQTDIKSKIKGISWFSVNIDGSHVSLEISESSGSNEIIDLTTPCNIVSGIDGELLRLEAHAGVPTVAPGSAVTKGDLLISGVMEKTDGSSYFVHARGTAVVRTNRNISAEIPHNTNIQKVIETKKRYSISIFGLNIPLGPSKNADNATRRSNMLSYREKALPVGIITDNYIVIIDEQTTLSENQAILLACFSTFSREMEIMQNSETESKTAQIQKNEKSIELSINYINHETTGIEKYFEITQ